MNIDKVQSNNEDSFTDDNVSESEINRLTEILLKSKSGKAGGSINKRKAGRPASKTNTSNKNTDLEIIVTMLKELKNDVSYIKEKVAGIEGKVNQNQARLIKLENKCVELEGENTKLKTKVNDLSKQIDELEIENRRNKVILTIPKVESKEMIKDNVKSILIDKLNISDDEWKKIQTLPIGNTNDKIILKLNDELLKGKLFKTIRTRQLQGIYINEYLTKNKLSLVKELRKMKKEGMINTVYTFEGKVYIKKSENGKKIKINNIDEVFEIEVPFDSQNSNDLEGEKGKRKINRFATARV